MNDQNLTTNLSLILLLSITLVGSAEVIEEELEELEQSIVVGSRQLSSWIDQAYSVSHVSLGNAEERFARNLVDSLKQTEGVLVQKTSTGQGSPFIRGFTGYRTLALIDGVRYNNSVYRDGPNEYFSLIDKGSIEKLELIHGPSSVAYGNDAIGGTISLFTKKSDYEAEEGLYSRGSIDYQFSSASSSHETRAEYEFGNGGDWGVRLGIGAKLYGNVRSANIGTQPNTGYDEYSFDLRFDKRLSSAWELTVVHQQLEQDDVWRTHSTIFARSFAGSEIGSDLRRLKDQRRTLSYFQLKGDVYSKWADDVKLNFSYQTWDENGDRTRGSGVRNVDYFDSRMWGVDLELKKQIGEVRLTYGFDFYEDNVESGRTDLSEDGFISVERIQGPVGDDTRYRQLGAYVNGIWRVNDRATLDVGTRYSKVSADVGRFENPTTGEVASFSGDWDALVSSVRFSYALGDGQNTRVWTGLSQSFRAPNIADLSRFGGSRSDEIEVASTGLDPESFLTFESGLKTETDRYKASVSAYYTLIDDYIISTPTGNIRENLNEVSRQNSSSGYVQGIEISGSYQLSPTLMIWGNATWIYGELDVFTEVGSTDKQREPLSRLAPPTFNMGLKWSSLDRKWAMGLDLQWALEADELSSGDLSDTQRIPPGGTPGYVKVDTYGAYQWSENLHLRLGLENILDEAYRVHGSGNNEAGFGVNIGAKLTF